MKTSSSSCVQLCSPFFGSRQTMHLLAFLRRWQLLCFEGRQDLSFFRLLSWSSCLPCVRTCLFPCQSCLCKIPSILWLCWFCDPVQSGCSSCGSRHSCRALFQCLSYLHRPPSSWMIRSCCCWKRTSCCPLQRKRMRNWNCLQSRAVLRRQPSPVQ